MNVTHKLGLTVVAAAVLGLYGCGKEEPKKAEAPKAPAEDVMTVKIGHAGPLTGGIAHLGKDDENGVHLAVSRSFEDCQIGRRIGILAETAPYSE